MAYGYGGGTQDPLDYYGKTYGYQWGDTKNFKDQQLADWEALVAAGQKDAYKDRIRTRYQPLDTSPLDEAKALADPGILGPLGITPEAVKTWFANMMKRNSKWAADEEARRLSGYETDFNRVANAGAGQIVAQGGAGSSGSNMAVGRAAGQYGRGKADIKSQVQQEAEDRYWNKAKMGLTGAATYAGIAGQDMDRKLELLMQELNLGKEERQYLYDLYEQYQRYKKEPFGINDIVNLAMTGLGAANMINPIAGAGAAAVV